MTGLTSPDFLAILAIISASSVSIVEKVIGLIAFHVVGSLILIIPSIAFHLFPERTTRLVRRMAAWTCSYRRTPYAVLLIVAGSLLIGLGWHYH